MHGSLSEETDRRNHKWTRRCHHRSGSEKGDRELSRNSKEGDFAQLSEKDYSRKSDRLAWKSRDGSATQISWAHDRKTVEKPRRKEFKKKSGFMLLTLKLDSVWIPSLCSGLVRTR